MRRMLHDTISGETIYEGYNYVPRTLSSDEIKKAYQKKVVELIRKKYDQNDENKLLALGIEDKTNPEYVKYRAYVEDCKAKAREFYNLS